MTITKLRSTAVFVAIFALMAVYALIEFGPNLTKSTASSKSAGTTASGTLNEGDRRRAIIRQLTQLYVSRNADASSRMVAGLEAAPATFLNQELVRQGAKWRVDKGSAGDIEIFDIS